MRSLYKPYIQVFILIVLFFSSRTLFPVTLNLKSAIEIGLKNNKELKVAIEKVKSSESELAITRSAFFPSIEAKANYTYIGIIPEAEMGSMSYIPMPAMTDPFRHTHSYESFTFKMARENNFDGSISLIQPIFMWGRLVNSYSLAGLKLNSEEENYKKTRIKVIYDIKDAFYSYLIIQKRAKLLEETYKQLEENVKFAQDNYRAGIITKYDLMTIEVQLANLEPSVIQVKDSIILAKERLKTVIGYDNDVIDAQDEFDYSSFNTSFEKGQERLLSDNPDLKMMEFQKQIMEKVITLSRSGNKPSLVGVLNYKYTYIPQNDKTFGGKEPNSWAATLSLSIPVSEWFPWSKTMNDIDKSKSGSEQIKLTYEQMKDGLMIQLKQVLLDLDTQFRLIQSQKRNIDKAKETYGFNRKQYRSGLIRNTELMDSQLALMQAEMNYLEAVYHYIMAKARLDLLLGNVNNEKF